MFMAGNDSEPTTVGGTQGTWDEITAQLPPDTPVVDIAHDLLNPDENAPEESS